MGSASAVNPFVFHNIWSMRTWRACSIIFVGHEWKYPLLFNLDKTYHFFLFIPESPSLNKCIDDIPSTALLSTLIFFRPSSHIPCTGQHRQTSTQRTQSQNFVFRKRSDLDFISSRNSVPELCGQLILKFEGLGTIGIGKTGGFHKVSDGCRGVG